MAAVTVKLSNGLLHPLVGFGTYKVGVVPASASAGAAVTRSAVEVVRDAVAAGYRCFDCAQYYGNEKDVGVGLASSGVAREELYIISKVWTTTIFEGEAAVRAQVEQSLADLQTTFLDLYLIHWPVPGKHIAAYQVLEKLVAEGKLRSIGLSNYTIEDYEELKPHITVPPVVNQFEINPLLFRAKTINFFKAEGIVLESYRTLVQGKAFGLFAVAALAAKYGRSPAQILGRWCVQHDIVYLGKSENPARMRENMDVFGFELASDDMAQLDALTTPDSLGAFKALYQKCVVRDTPLQESKTGVKDDITIE